MTPQGDGQFHLGVIFFEGDAEEFGQGNGPDKCKRSVPAVSEEWHMRKVIFAALLLALPFGGIAQAAQADRLTPRQQRVALDVELALLRLPYYDVFDSLGYELQDKGVVRLVGQVRTPWLKDDAERAVKRVAGVDTVVNEIEILPANINDDRLRWAVYRSLFGSDSPLDRYALGASPAIRIIVKNGHVTLEGIVLNNMDRTIAGMKARQVFGVFGVTNNLAVERQS